MIFRIITVVEKAQESVPEEEVVKIVKTQNKDGSFEVPQKITEDIGQNTIENISTSVRITDERAKKFDTKVWSTFITLAYCNKVLGKHQSKLTTQNQRAIEYLNKQVGDEKLVKEILESCEKVVVEKVADKKNVETKTKSSSSWTGWLSKTVSDAGSYATKTVSDTGSYATKAVTGLGKYTIDSVSQTAESAASLLQSRTTPEVAKNIVSTQKSDGSITLSKDVSKQIDISPENIQSSIKTYNVSEKLTNVPKNVWETALSLRYLTISSPQSQEQYKEQSNKAKEYLIKQLGDEKLVNEVLETSDKIIVEKSAQKEKEDTSTAGKVGKLVDKFETSTTATLPKDKSVPTDKPTAAAPADTQIGKTTPKAAPTDKITPKVAAPVETPIGKTVPKDAPKDAPKDETTVVPEQKSTAIKLSKDVEDAITCDDDNEHEKAVALDTVKSSTTREVIQNVVSKQNDDGSIEVNETICEQLDEPSEEKVVTTVQQYVTTKNLKNAKPSWITTAVNIAYLRNLADYQGEMKQKYEKARQYLAKEIGNPKIEDELINASEKYVVQKLTQKVIKDEKKAAILAVRSKIPEATVNDALSSQNKDGSFEISETITRELDNTSPKDLVKKAQSYVTSNKISPEKSESIFKTALTIGFLRTAMGSPSNNLSEKYNKAREYLKSQIGNPELEEEIIKASSKVVIDKSSEKVAKESKKAALEEIQKSTTPETARAVVSKQSNDGSIEVSEEITDKLNSPSSSSLVTSVTTYTTNKKLKNISPKIWTTALSM